MKKVLAMLFILMMVLSFFAYRSQWKIEVNEYMNIKKNKLHIKYIKIKKRLVFLISFVFI